MTHPTLGLHSIAVPNFDFTNPFSILEISTLVDPIMSKGHGYEARTLEFGWRFSVRHVWDTNTLGHVPNTCRTLKKLFDFF